MSSESNNETIRAVNDLEDYVYMLIKKYKSLQSENQKLKQNLQSIKKLSQEKDNEINALQNQLQIMATSKSMTASNEEVIIMKKQIADLVEIIDESLKYLK